MSHRIVPPAVIGWLLKGSVGRIRRSDRSAADRKLLQADAQRQRHQADDDGGGGDDGDEERLERARELGPPDRAARDGLGRDGRA